MPPTKSTIPPFADLTEKKLRSLGAKLDKLVDANGFKQQNLLWKHSDDASELLWHLARHGLVLQEEVRSAGLLGLLGDSAHKATAADIVAVLRRIPPDMGALDKGEARNCVMFTPGMLVLVDNLITAAYIGDRAALMSVREEAPENLRLAIDFVRRRAGETIEPAASEAILRHMVTAHCEHGLNGGLDAPLIVEGELVSRPLRDHAAVAELAELFGPPSAWGELLLDYVKQRVQQFRDRPDSYAEPALPGLRLATLSDVVYLFGDGYTNGYVLLNTFDARGDAPAELFAAAAKLLAEGTAPFKITTPQIRPPKPERARRSHDEDEDEDEDDGEEYDGGGEYDEYDGSGGYTGEDEDVEESEEDEDAIKEAPGSDERVRTLAMVMTIVGIERARATGQAIPAGVEKNFDVQRIYDSVPQLIARVRAALAVLEPAQAHAVIRATLAERFGYGKVAAIADVHFDPGLVEEVLTRIGEGEYGVDAGLLGFCSPKIVPLLAQAQERMKNPKIAEGFGEAILYVLGRASAAGVERDPGLDRHIQLDRINFNYGGEKVEMVQAMLDKLPLERYVRVLEANVERCREEPWRLVRVLRPEVPPQLLDMVLGTLMARRQTIGSGSLGERLRKFGQTLVGPLLRAVGDAPAENTFVKELERALGHEVFVAVKAGLGKAIETPEQELRRLAASVPGPTVRVYRLARGEGGPAAGTVGRIGGTPRGVIAVPQDRGEPMQHIITLDLAQMPEVAERYPGARSVSLYLPDPDTGSRHELGTLVWTREDELGRAEGSTAGARAVLVEGFDVPRSIFEGGELEGAALRVRKIVYTSRGYAGGGPLWLQDGPPGVDAAFLFQFDEGLCSINLGDCGVMYVFEHDVTWQCH